MKRHLTKLNCCCIKCESFTVQQVSETEGNCITCWKMPFSWQIFEDHLTITGDSVLSVEEAYEITNAPIWEDE